MTDPNLAANRHRKDDKTRRELAPVTRSGRLPEELGVLWFGLGLTKEQMDTLLLRTVPYIVRRDHTVFNHGYMIGEKETKGGRNG